MQKIRKLISYVIAFILFFSILPIKTAYLNSFNLTATPKCGYILLEWETVPDAVRYYIYRGPGEGQEYSMPLTDFAIVENYYKDNNDLQLNQKYCYFIKAVNSNDEEFLQSTEACAVMTCKDEVPELVPEDCKMVLKYQVDNTTYWKNDIPKGPMPVAPEIRFSRVNLMARFLAEEIGGTVGWDANTHTVIITMLDGTTIEYQIGNHIFKRNGLPLPIDPNNSQVVPYISNSRTYVPLRSLAENLGATGPNDIIWRADTKIAELIFNDPNCKWICGCFKKLPPSSTTANIVQYGFYENCDSTTPVKIKIISDMKDRLLKLNLTEYINKYPNQAYWCAEIRVDESGNMVGWRARPDKYPDCCKPATPTDCKWTPGTILKAGQTAGANTWTILFAPNCNQQNAIELQLIGTLVDANLGITIGDYLKKYPDHKYWCVELCIDQNRKIVKWRALPAKYPNCCDEVQTKKICACIVRMTIQPDNNGFYQVYISTGCNPSNTAPFDLVLNFPATLLDINLGMTALDYYNSIPGNPPKSCCIEVAFNSSNIAVQWWAYPDRSPCCPTVEECKWICGCILKVEPPSGTVVSNSWKITFDPECKGNNPVELNISGDLIDSNLGITIGDYIKKYPDHKYWCVELCINNDRKIVKWRATPERYPDCCKEEPQDGGRIVVKMPPNCYPGTVVVIYDINGNVVWEGKADTPGGANTAIFDTGCKLKCPAVYKIVPKNEKCKFTPETQEVNVPCCPEIATIAFECDCGEQPTDCKWICGCILKAGQIAGANIWTIAFAPNCKEQNIVELQLSGTLVDANLGITIGDYIKKYPDHKYWCVELCIDANRKIVKWRALPAKYPNCCDEEPQDGGRIRIHMPKDCVIGTTINIYDVLTGEIVKKVTRDDWVESFFDIFCTLPCPKEYKVVPVNEKCKFTPESQLVKVPCCPEIIDVKFDCDCSPSVKNGRIKGLVFGNCNPGTIINIYDSTGAVAWSGQTDTNGNYDTGVDCKLICGATYKVVPTGITGSNCTYSPPSREVTIKNCCPESAVSNGFERADFKCDCTDQGGRIIIKMPENCIPGTTVYIYDLNGNLVWSGVVNPAGTPNAGVFDTGCKLKCPSTYKVIPKNEKCKFTPESEVVKVECCPKVTTVAFECDCGEPKGGRIIAMIPKDCIPGTNIVVYNLETGAAVMTLTPNNINSDGYYDTGCKLKCPLTYKVVPTNPNITFSPASQEVKVPCCPEVAKVEFRCTPIPQGGRIIVMIPKECIQGTSILIYDSASGAFVMTLTTNNINSDGYFDTGCKLKCPLKYKIVPTSTTVTFSPTSQEIIVPCCPEIARADFKCTPIPQGGRIIVMISKDCIPGTTISIYDATGTVAMTLTANNVNSDGYFDTGCKLKCPTTYKVVPTNPNFTFSPASQEVRVPCCPEVARVEFKCTPIPQGGRIIVMIPKDCMTGTVVNIYDATGAAVMTLTANNVNSDGYYDTGCKLKCPSSYNVIPYNPNFAFSPTSQQVKVLCCPEISRVDFKCVPQAGRIVVKMPKNCIEGTTLTIYTPNRTVVWTGKANDQGVFDTGCILKCPTSYIVVPRNEKCKFRPESQEVNVPCCPEVATVAFECNCEQPGGRIVVKMSSDCLSGTTVYIYNMNNVEVWHGTANAAGTFDTDCILPCLATYNVVPKNSYCKFSPESQQVRVPCCPEIVTVEFKCTCSRPKTVVNDRNRIISKERNIIKSNNNNNIVAILFERFVIKPDII